VKTLLLLFISLSVSAVEVGEKIQNDFTLKEYGSEKIFKLSDHLGKKIIVMNFWASWCTSCATEIPDLHKLKRKYPNALFLGLNAGEKAYKMKKFIKRHKFNYLILKDPNRKVSKSFGVTDLPKTIVIGKDRKVQFLGNRPPKKL